MKRVKVHRWLGPVAAALLVAALLPAGASAYTTTDFRNLRAKYYEFLTGGTVYSPTDTAIEPKLRQLNADANALWRSMDTSGGRTYLWSDAAFVSGTTRSELMQYSYERLRTMTTALTTRCAGVTGCLYADSTLKADIISALDWLTARWFYPRASEVSNWYPWDLGVPMALTETMIMLWDDLNATQRSDHLAAVGAHMYRSYTGSVSEGANRAWAALIFMLWGAMSEGSAGNDAVVTARDGLSYLFDEVSFYSDGFYYDGSYMGHAYYAYSGGYGAAYYQSTANMIHALRGSIWEVTDSDQVNLVRWAFKAYQPLIYKGGMYDLARGRNISVEQETDHNAAGWIIASMLLVQDLAGTTDKALLRSQIKQWLADDVGWYTDMYTSVFSIVRAEEIVDDSGVTPTGTQSRTKVYPVMHKAFSQQPRYGLGISMFGYDQNNYEQIRRTSGGTWQNIYGWHQSDGMTQLYVGDDIDQYRGHYWPTVNSYKLPGTTVQQNTAVGTTYNAQRWSGGTSDGTYGVAGIYLQPNGTTIHAKKSWFMFDDEVVALGAGITSTGGSVVETVVDNRKLNANGDNVFTVGGTRKSSTTGSNCTSYRGWSETMSSVSWMHLAGTTNSSGDLGYYFPNATTVKGNRVRGCGAWYDINTLDQSRTVRENHFLATWIDHGSNPTNATYAYVLLPGMSATDTANYASSPEIEVIRNDANIQAAKDTALGLVGANFWNSGTQSINVGRYSPFLTTDSASSVLVHNRQVSGTWYTDLSVADPTWDNTTGINLEIAYPATRVISADAGVTVTQLSPTIRVTIDPTRASGQPGKTFRLRLQD